MKPQSNFIGKSRAAVIALSGVALALGLVVVRAQGDEWNKKTTLTINQPMQVQDTYLEPGQYVFKLLDSQSNRNIVQIYNGQETHLITTILAIPDYRIQPTSKSRFTMWETPAGYVAALKDWYWPGDNFGQQFRYPKHLRAVEVAEAQQTVVTPAPPVPEAAPAPAPQEQAQVEQQQTDIAQNTPPPPPPAVEEQPITPATAPAVLPKTASPYPLIGLMGLLLIGLGSLLRMTRSA